LPLFIADTTVTVAGTDPHRYAGGGLVVAALPVRYGDPVRVIRRPSGPLPMRAWRSGTAAFDNWYRVEAVTPTVLLTRPIVLAIAARGDWNFSVRNNWLICLLTAPFGSADHVDATVDAVAALAAALPRPLRRSIGA
jgi:hypothetical protein